MTIIYDPNGRPGALDALIQTISGRVFLRTEAHYSGPEAGASVVYTDSDAIAADYEARGVSVYGLDGDSVPETPQPRDESGPVSVGGGWYDVVVDGDVKDRVQGKAKAEARYEELQANAGEPDESNTNDTE